MAMMKKEKDGSEGISSRFSRQRELSSQIALIIIIIINSFDVFLRELRMKQTDVMMRMMELLEQMTEMN